MIGALASIASSTWAVDGIPTALPLSRYEAMTGHSPFAIASENASVNLPVAAGFAKDLMLTGAVHLSNGDYITVASRDQAQVFSLRTGTTYNGISLVSVTWSDAIGKTRATLKCGTEFSTISFDEAMLRQVPNAEAAPATQDNRPQKPVLPAGVLPPTIRRR